jgi:GT2 family glycosyltransferase
MQDIRIKVIIMTYIDRFDLVKKTLESLNDEYIVQILLVDNGCTYDLVDSVSKHMSGELISKLDVIKIDSPKGTAGTVDYLFSINHDKCTHILMLDDDNVLCGELSYLKGELEKPINIINLIRRDREPYASAINSGERLTVVKNSFMGFSLMDYFKRNFGASKSVPAAGSKCYIESEYLPYGGTIIPIGVLKKIHVNKEFILYHDDVDFFYRCNSQGFCTRITSKCSIVDIDTSWHDKSDNIVENAELKPDNAFYAIRNKVNFEKATSTNIHVFNLNRLIWMLYFWCKYLGKRNSPGFLLILKAIRDGLKGRLGLYSS